MGGVLPRLGGDCGFYYFTDRPAMTIAVDLGRKATKQTKNLKGVICDTKQKHNIRDISLYK